VREMTLTGPEPIPSVGPPPFTCLRSSTGRVARVTLAGELDIAAVSQFDEALRRAQADAPLVVLDLRALEFIDASAATLLFAADRRIRRVGGRLVVVRGRATIHSLFALIGLDQKLEFIHRPFAAITDPVPFSKLGEIEEPSHDTRSTTR
jgi:anti-sigma B factor antagonist